MEHSDAAKRPKLSDGGGEDRLSALPNDILIHVLVKLGAAAYAGRTSVLSRRWRGLWALLPELHFSYGTEPHRIRSALAAHEAPTIDALFVSLRDADPESVATWLPIAAPRLSGDLTILHYRRNQRKMGAVELPCIERATEICLVLDDLGLTLPPSGVFARLTDLCLRSIILSGQCSLSDIVSSPRCPSLRKLILCNVHSVGILSIRSESLLQIELKDLDDVQQLIIVAPALKVLKESCGMAFEPLARISAPRLTSLQWEYYSGPRSVQFDRMPHLFQLHAGRFPVYGHPHNRIRLLQCFESVSCLYLTLVYPKEIANHQYLMEEMPRLPYVTLLSLNLEAQGHSFGASLFHVLRMCTSVRKLALAFDVSTEQLKGQTECPSDCVCDQPPNWQTEKLLLSCLENIEITA